MSTLIRVIPLSLEESRTHRININKCATIPCSYYKSIWRSLTNSKLELSNRAHVLNFCYIFILSILSCFGMASSVISISAVFFMRFSYFNQYSSLTFGIVLAASDMAMILAVAVASVYYFFSFNRAVIIILGALNMIAIVLYFLCILFYENLTLGILLLLIWRVLLGVGGLIQVMGIFYSCSFSQVQKELKSNYFSTMLVAYHTSNYIQVWTTFGPVLGLVFVSVPNPLLLSSSKVDSGHSSPIRLLFNGFTAFMWVVAVLMLLFLTYFMKHYHTIKGDTISTRSNTTALPSPLTPPSDNSFDTDVIRRGGAGRREVEGVGEDVSSQDRLLNDNGNNNSNNNSSDSNNNSSGSSGSSGSSCSSNSSSNSDGKKKKKAWRWLDIELLSTRNIEVFNLINYSHIKSCEDGISDHKNKALSLVKTSLILLLSSEVLLVFVFYGYFWNLASLAIGCSVINTSEDFYVVYISIVLGTSCATLFTWNHILEKLSRYKFTCLSYGQSLYPFMSGTIFGISCMMTAAIILTINSFLLDRHHLNHTRSNSPSILYHSANFLMGLGFCYAFVSSEDAIFFLSNYVSASDSQLLFKTDISTSDLTSNLTSSLSPMHQCLNVNTSNIDGCVSNAALSSSSSTHAPSNSDAASAASASSSFSFRSRPLSGISNLGISEQDSFGHHWFRIKVVHVLRFVTISFGRLAGVVTTSAILTFVPIDNNNLDLLNSNSSSNNNIISLGSINSTGSLFDKNDSSKCSIPWLSATGTATNNTAASSYSPCRVNNLSYVSIVYVGASLTVFVIYLVLFNKIMANKSLRYLTGKTLDRFTSAGYGTRTNSTGTSKADKLELSKLRHLGIDVNFDVHDGFE